jgi:hypothetical protein
MGFAEPIVLLTAVHFHAAGLGLSALARLRLKQAPHGSLEHRLATFGGWLSIAGIPCVAIGHLTSGYAEFGGALVMTSAAWMVAASTSLAAVRYAAPHKHLLIISALAPIAPMLLAVHYAAAQASWVTQFRYDTYAIAHGSVNLVLFIGIGLLTASSLPSTTIRS